VEQALGLFQALGAPLWARRAREDLARVSGAAPPPGELTPTEQRIAQLVGEGRKNREVAEALFISVKTVEANLSRIFHKLGVRSHRAHPPDRHHPRPEGSPIPHRSGAGSASITVPDGLVGIGTRPTSSQPLSITSRR
jgi:DNA-binding CsgD family transcriptional regulator